MKIIKVSKGLCWVSILCVLLTSIILCIIGYNIDATETQTILLSVGTGLGASATISLLFYGVQYLQDKEKSKSIRETYLPNLKMLAYFIIFYATLEKHHKFSEESVKDFLKNESAEIKKLTEDKKVELFESASLIVNRESFNITVNTIQLKIDILLQNSAISTTEYKELTFILYCILFIKSGLQSEDFEKVKSCYSDLLLSLKRLISNTSEIKFLEDIIVNGVSFKSPKPTDKLTNEEKQILSMFT